MKESQYVKLKNEINITYIVHWGKL